MSPSARAWLAVFLLWPVALLNYLDRQAVYSVFPLLRMDLAVSDLGLGALSTAFLWVYGLASPLSGVLADRWSRRRLILGSLAAWSLVTWWTAHAGGFGELLATGIHQSGIYAGVVLGGVLGGWLGERYGWRAGFNLLGLAGIAYATILGLLWIRPDRKTPRPHAIERPSLAPSMWRLLGRGDVRIMLLACAMVSAATWTAFSWLPLFVYERYRASLTTAGFSATFYIQTGSCLGVLLGGWLADRWTRADRRGRILTQALGLSAAGPCLLLAGATHSLTLLAGSLFLFGLGRGFYDCNTMPALCLVVPEAWRGTAYGWINLAGTLFGGLMAAFAGAVKSSLGLGGAIQLTACLVLGAAFLLTRIRIEWKGVS